MKKRKPAPHSAPVLCDYCGQRAVLIDSKEIYGRSYGRAWMCKPCQAYVGCHPGTTRPLGRLADKELREAKKAAHAAFDPLWKRGSMTRTQAYAWLSAALGIPAADCHIGMFDLSTCGRVVAEVIAYTEACGRR
jgi:hypothetical protein